MTKFINFEVNFVARRERDGFAMPTRCRRDIGATPTRRRRDIGAPPTRHSRDQGAMVARDRLLIQVSKGGGRQGGATAEQAKSYIARRLSQPTSSPRRGAGAR
jgi:hypothetical protein